MTAAIQTLAVLLILTGLLELANYFGSIGSANSAPQQAALSAMVLAPTICLYVVARGFEMIAKSRQR